MPRIPVADTLEATASRDIIETPRARELRAARIGSPRQHDFRGGRGGEVTTYADGVPVRDPLARSGVTLPAAPPAQSRVTAGGFGTRHGNASSGETALPPPASDHDELWVIERTHPSARPTTEHRNGPRSGALLAELAAPEGGPPRTVPVPLEHTAVSARISAFIATVQVTQRFCNPFDRKIEAVYQFPLPHDAAVDAFIMTIGERRIRGIIRERQEAERIYQQALRQGYVASLLTQERPNIFSQSVANIEPGRSVEVEIRYLHTLAYTDGWYEFVFPMVVGPRYNPAGSRDGIGAVARGAHGRSGQSTEIEYLAPDERSGHDIALDVELDAGVHIEELASVSHTVRIDRTGDSTAHVTLAENDRVPNRDFVLRYRVAGERIKTALLTHRDERGGFFTLVLYPPAGQRSLPRAPVEMVFVLDCSGSMEGQPLAKAKQAIERALRLLDADDTFQIIRFSAAASQLGPAPLRAAPVNVQRGIEHLRGLNAGGGTEMLAGIRAALAFPADPRRQRLVTFATDGYIGNETAIFAEISEHRGNARIFSFGIGSSVNRYLIEGMARFGKGAAAFVGLDESAGQAVDRFYERVCRPALTGIEIDWGDWQVSDVYPRTLPDLFVGRAIAVSGRFSGDASDPIRISGLQGGRRHTCSIGAGGQGAGVVQAAGAARAAHPGVAAVWARRKLMDLCDIAAATSSPALAREITEFALDFNLASPYTAFVAVAAGTRTDGALAATVKVPVPVPQGVSYETTVAGATAR